MTNLTETFDQVKRSSEIRSSEYFPAYVQFLFYYYYFMFLIISLSEMIDRLTARKSRFDIVFVLANPIQLYKEVC